jgi:drug/metabolite transporter, DME family
MTIGELAALASALSWASTTVMMRAVSARMDPLTMNTLRSIVGALFFVVTVIVLDKVGAFAQVTSVTFLALCGSLMFGYVFGDTLFFKAMQLVGVSIAMPISMSYPLYVLFIAWALLGERITLFTVIGTLIVITGTISIAMGAQAVPVKRAGDRKLGVTLAVLSALCFAGSTSVLKIGVQDVDVIVAGAIRMNVTAIVLLLWRSTMTRGEPFRAYGLKALVVIAIASIVGSGVGTITYLTAVQQSGAALAATLATTAPLFATPLSVIFLKERLTRRTLLGMMLCVMGVWIVIPR